MHRTRGDIKAREARLGLMRSPRMPTLARRPRWTILEFWHPDPTWRPLRAEIPGILRDKSCIAPSEGLYSRGARNASEAIYRRGDQRVPGCREPQVHCGSPRRTLTSTSPCSIRNNSRGTPTSTRLLQLRHQRPHQQPQPSPMASPKNVRQELSVAIISSLMPPSTW